MKMNIKFAKPTDPNEIEFTPGEKKYFFLLMEIPTFQIVISKTRKACGIPVDGIATDSDAFRNIDHKRLINIAILLTSRLNLAWNWTTTITALLIGLPLVKHRVCIPPISSTKGNGKVTITVNEQMSRTELAELIRKNKALKDQLDTLPVNKIQINKKTLSVDLSIRQIYNLVTTYSKSGKARKNIKLLERIRSKFDPEDIMFQEMTYKDMDTRVTRLNDYLSSLFTHKDLLTYVMSNEPIEKLLK